MFETYADAVAQAERLRATNAAMTRDIARMNLQITGLEEDVERLEANLVILRASLRAINRCASPVPDRTFDSCSRDLYWCACEARAALSEKV
jgi:hypothetical protein